MAVVGPAIGYILGGQLLKVYIDAPVTDPASFGLTPSSDLWLGGWWVGFVISGSLAIIIAWPLMAFPAKLPGFKTIQASRIDETHGNSQSGSFGRLREMPASTRTLLANPTFVAVSLAGASEAFVMSGFATFTPKFLESQFSISASFAAMLVGAVAVPAGGGGTFLGGWLVKKFSLRCVGILKMCICMSTLCFIACFSFFASCPNPDFAGVTVDYDNLAKPYSMLNLTSSCNSQCQCPTNDYDPVCGTNNVIYYSPCHAGCQVESATDGDKEFTECSCVGAPVGTSASSVVVNSASRAKCPSLCSLLPGFIVMFFLLILFTFLANLPSLTATLRCVPVTHRSFGLGVQWILVRILGSIPGPILFGTFIDRTCLLWPQTCGNAGSCRRYDNFYFSRYMMGTALVGKSFSIFFFVLAWLLYVPPKTDEIGNNAEIKPVRSAQVVPSAKTGIDNPALELN